MSEQNTETDGTAPTLEKQCVECAETISAGAKKCRHCGAYQTRTYRWFGPLVTVLSLLVAIISLVLGGVDQVRDLFWPRTPLFAVLENDGTGTLFLNVHNESGDSVVVEDMMCFMAYTADPDDTRYMDSLWMDDKSSIIAPGERSRYAVQWMASGEIDQAEASRFDAPLPRASIDIRRWSSTCGCNPGRDMNETIAVPVSVCRLYFRTFRNTVKVYDFRASAIDSDMLRMIDAEPNYPTIFGNPVE